MAEIALSLLQQQCLDCRIPDADTLTREIAAWEHQRNGEQAALDWRFAVSDARKKLKRLSPSLPYCEKERFQAQYSLRKTVDIRRGVLTE